MLADHARVAQDRHGVRLAAALRAHDLLESEVVAATLILVVVEGAEGQHVDVCDVEGPERLKLADVGRAGQFLQGAGGLEHAGGHVDGRLDVVSAKPFERGLEALHLVAVGMRDEEGLQLERHEARLLARLVEARGNQAAVHAHKFLCPLGAYGIAAPALATPQHMQLKHRPTPFATSLPGRS